MIRYANRLPPGCKLLEDGKTVRKTALCSEQHTLEFMEVLVNHFIRYPDPLVVPVFHFEVLANSRNNQSYFYDMQRLGMLSLQEKDLVDRIGDLTDKHGPDAMSIPWLPLELYPERHSQPELFSYLQQVVRLNRYHDLHSGNVMIDEQESYRLIDLEGFSMYSLDHSANDWITR